MNAILQPVTRRAAFVLTAACASLGLPAPAAVAAETKTAEAIPENYIDIGAGGSLLKGDRDSFQKINSQKKDGWGGISGFHYGQDLDKTTTLTLDGRAFAGNDDFKLNLKLSRENVGFVVVGYNQYRTWFDGSGGYFPPSGLFLQLYNEDLHIDRKDFWVELGLTPPDKINFNFRYDYTTREGLKDSTMWGDSTATAGLGTRAVIPTFLRIKEHRHIVNAKVFQDGAQSSWEFVGRYETSKQDNVREVHRTPGSPTTDRYQTTVDGADRDLFMVRGTVESKIGETLSMSTGIAHYDLDANLDGSRIGGSDGYDPVFSATYARRQFHDEGFRNLEGTAHMKETLANLNLMFTPTEKWSIVPALRAEKTSWGASAEYIETSVGAGPAFVMAQDENESDSNKQYRNLTELVDVHYTGLKDVALNSSLEWTQSYGTLSEDLIAKETGVDTIYRTTDFRRDAQKYVVTAHWYAQPGLSVTGQYYWKGRQNSFNNTRQSTNPNPPSGDRYPAYITHQDTETNDFNLRTSWAPTLNLRSVTRYDYQENKIRTQEIGLAFTQSGKITSHILSESVTWNPLDRWYLQATGNLIYDRTVTPAHDLTGPAAGIVLNSDNNYWSYDLTTGCAVDDRSDLTATFSYYRADNSADNSRYSVAYGASFTNQLFTLMWTRRISPYLNYAVRYTYGDYDDVTSGGFNNYRAHTVYAKVQYRF